MEGYYQTNNEVLKFRIDKEQDKILFNHYISQKENLQRLKRDLPRGQFYLIINSAAKDLNMTVDKIKWTIKKFIELGVITKIYAPPKGSKKPSIYQYNVAVLSGNNPYDNTYDNTYDKPDNSKGLENPNPYDNTYDNTHSKKENIKRIDNNICIQVINILNGKIGTSYRPNARVTQKLIGARLNEGFTLEDFQKVINIKTAEWKDTEFEKFLRPQTLFGTKFESYLNQAKKSKSSENNYEDMIQI